MENMYDKVKESVEFIRSKIKCEPHIGVVLGSGLGDIVSIMEEKEYINYEDIPNFPRSTVQGHEGRLVFGKINGIAVLTMQGRFHYYEGYSMKEVTYPIYVMKLLGIKKLIVTNACGGINTNYHPGTLMIITDFINLMFDNPLIGINDDRFGERFPDMSEPYKLDLIEKAECTAHELQIDFEKGIYAGCTGPYFETAAEIRMIRTNGADVVGMSTVPETIVANYLNIDVLGISCVTNMATGIQKQKHSHENVLKMAEQASIDLSKWIVKIIEKIS